MTVATTSTEECSASEISARLPIAMPTTNLAVAMPALAKIEIAATRDLVVGSGWPMAAGLAARHGTLKTWPRRNRHLVAIALVTNYQALGRAPVAQAPGLNFAAGLDRPVMTIFTKSRRSCRDACWLPCARTPCRYRRRQTPCRSAIAICVIPPPARYPCG